MPSLLAPELPGVVGLLTSSFAARRYAAALDCAASAAEAFGSAEGAAPSFGGLFAHLTALVNSPRPPPSPLSACRPSSRTYLEAAAVIIQKAI